MNCPLCCEGKPTMTLSCAHQSCQACLVRWIEKVELTGQQELPTCPFCRVHLSQEEVETLLGRCFQPASSATAPAAAGGVLDDLTLQWLQENTRQCNNCGTHIEKEDGCDKMECLCGYRFCFSCGIQGAQCVCSPIGHTFWDNISEEHADCAQPLVANFSIPNQPANLRSHIKKRKFQIERRRRGEMMRSHRADRRWRQEEERKHVDAFPVHAAIVNGSWLFCRTTEKSSRVLWQLMGWERNVRSRRKQERDRQAAERQRAQDGKDSLHESVINGSWLFCRTTENSSSMLSQLMGGKDVGLQRRKQRRGRWAPAQAFA